MRIVALLLIAVAETATAQSPIDVTLARSYFAEVKQLGARDNGRLWGRMVSGPMMFVDPSTHAIVANEADSQGKLHEADGVWVGTLPNETNTANTAFEFGGRMFSMVQWPVPDGRYSRDRLLMHESFHRIQRQLGFEGSNPSNNHLATADGRIWTRLEWRALGEALLHTGAARKAALTDALTFRARRRSSVAIATVEENQLEINEGLAEYTGLVLSGLPRSVLADRAAVALAQNESQESLVRSFAYTSGPAYGILLDESGAVWRRSVKSSSDLSEIAKRAYGIGVVDPARADQLIARYDGARMVATEKQRETKRLANEARLRSIFSDSAVLKLPVGSKFDFAFDPNSVVALPGTGSVYQTTRITDTWGVLESDDGEILMLRDAKGFITGVVAPFPVVNGMVVKGKGWTLAVSPDWTTAAGSRPGEISLVKRSQQ